jgi:hypothetical protein
MEEDAVIHDEAADMRQFWPITVMKHTNELWEWIANTITIQFGIQLVQLWKYHIQSDQQNRPELLALASTNISAPMTILACSPIVALVEMMAGPQNRIALQPVGDLFPNYLAILLRRRSLTHCAGYCAEQELDLLIGNSSRLTRTKIILLLFFGESSQGSLAEIRSFLERVLVLAEKHRLLYIHRDEAHWITSPPSTPPVISNNAVDYYNQGKALFARQCYQEALAAYEQTIRLDPNYVDAYNGMGDTLLQLERGEEAQEAYKQAVLRSIKRIR